MWPSFFALSSMTTLLGWFSPGNVGGRTRLRTQQAGFLEIPCNPRMEAIGRRRRHGVLRRGVDQLLGCATLPLQLVQRLDQAVRHGVVEAGTRQHEAPGAHGRNSLVLAGETAGRLRDLLQERMLGEDALDLAGVGRHEARALLAFRNRREPRPAGAAAP